MTPMTTKYRVYDPEKNQYLGSFDDKNGAIEQARSLYSLYQIRRVEVHELEANDEGLVNPRLVYKLPG